MRKHRYIKPLSASAAALLMTSIAYAGDISVQVTGFSNDTGFARIILMKGESGYHGSQAPKQIVEVPIYNNEATWTANGIAPGTYSLLAHHDADANGELNRPIFGLPLEPYGFSSAAWTSAGLPGWEEVSFSIGRDPVLQKIHLRMNVFAVFGQIATIGVPALAAVFGGLALINFRRRNKFIPTNS